MKPRRAASAFVIAFFGRRFIPLAPTLMRPNGRQSLLLLSLGRQPPAQSAEGRHVVC